MATKRTGTRLAKRAKVAKSDSAVTPLERFHYEIEARFADGGMIGFGALAPGSTLAHAIDAAKTGALDLAQQHGQQGVWARVIEVRGETRTVVHEGDVTTKGRGKKATHSYKARAKVRSEVRPDG